MYIFRENIGETVVFQWVEKIREVLQAIKPEEKKEPKPEAVESLDLALVSFYYLKLTLKIPDISLMGGNK